MKRWTIGELENTSLFELASVILGERSSRLNPYSPLASRLKEAQRLMENMDFISKNTGVDSASAEKTIEILYRDGYNSAAHLIEKLLIEKATTKIEAKSSELSNKKVHLNLGASAEVLEEMLSEYKYDIRMAFTDKREAALSMALKVLKEPDLLCCGGCGKFGYECVDGDGWCEEHDRVAYCDDEPCKFYELEDEEGKSNEE